MGLAELPPYAEIVRCKWVFTIKYNSNVLVVAKRYIQIYGKNFFKTSSSIARMGGIQLVIENQQ